MYCKNCGKNILIETDVCPECGVSLGSGHSFCQNCGTACEDLSSFCTGCGAPLTEAAKAAQESSAPNFDTQAPKAPNPPPVYTQPNGYSQQQNQYSQQNAQGYYNTQYAQAQRSKVAAILLAIFLGTLGIHNFYLGYNGKAIAQLLITLLSCGILAVVSAIWSFVEMILIACGNICVDANGVPLGN